MPPLYPGRPPTARMHRFARVYKYINHKGSVLSGQSQKKSLILQSSSVLEWNDCSTKAPESFHRQLPDHSGDILTFVIDMENIKNIIFDLGGVVIDLERESAVNALRNLGVNDTDRLLGQYEQKGPFLLLESGLISSAQFYDVLLPLCRPGTTCTDIQDAFEKFLVGLPSSRLAAITALRNAGFKVFVLSNTNPVMFNHWIDLAFRQEGKSINDYFDGIVTSYQERTCKPDPRIFMNLLNRYALQPSETLLLDDSAANCESAAGLGIHTVRVTPYGDSSFDAITDRLREEGPAK